MNDFHFLRPNYLFLFIPFFILSFLLLRTKFNYRIWHRFCSSDLIPYILTGKTQRRPFSYFLTFATFTLLILAAAGPAWQTIAAPLIKSQTGLLIALDLSKTMDAKDIKPSRLQRAIFKLNDILDARRDGFTALAVFSENPYVVTPMTDDVSTIKALLPALDTTIMPTAGHNPYKAISKGIDLLHQAGISNGSVLLITSELTNSEMEKSIEIARLNGIKIFVLGVGTDQAAPVQNQDGGLVKDNKGALLISMLSKENLHYLAHSTGGAYATITPDDTDIQYLLEQITALDRSGTPGESEMTQNNLHDQGYLLILFALPFISLIFRRGVLILVLFISPYTLQALDWNDLWKTPDQQAEELFHQEDYLQAKDKFRNPDWQAASAYKSGDFEKAAELYQTDQSTEGLYNYGTTKARQGDYKSALEAYKKALEIDPEHEDTIYNKKLIEDLLKKDQDNKNKQKNKDKQNKGKNKNPDQKNQNNDSQDSDNSANSDQPENSEDADNSKNSDDSNDSGDSEEDEDSQNSSNDKENSEQDDEDEPEKKNTQETDQNDNPNETQKPDEEELKELQDQYAEQVEKELEKQPGEKPLKHVPVEENDPEESQRQIDERRLQRIKDDPSGLLRRKFLLQSREQK